MSLPQLDFLHDEISLFPPVFSLRPDVEYRARRASRQRGVVLTDQGWKKLLEMKVLQNQNGEWHTYEFLGDDTLLSPRTVSKIVGRQTGVDRRTLKQFFDAFRLLLESDDYCLVSCGAKPISNSSHKAIALVLPFNL